MNNYLDDLCSCCGNSDCKLNCMRVPPCYDCGYCDNHCTCGDLNYRYGCDECNDGGGFCANCKMCSNHCDCYAEFQERN